MTPTSHHRVQLGLALLILGGCGSVVPASIDQGSEGEGEADDDGNNDGDDNDDDDGNNDGNGDDDDDATDTLVPESCDSVGVRDCVAVTPRLCDASGFFQMRDPCPFGCVEGLCTGECVPGSVECDDDVPQACDVAGAWVAGQCATGCFEGTCPELCATNSTRCSGDALFFCDDNGSWGNGTGCAHGCGGGACEDPCRQGALRCFGKIPQTCDGVGDWQAGAACPFECVNGRCEQGGGEGEGGGAEGEGEGEGEGAEGEGEPRCEVGSRQCLGLTPQTCNAQGRFVDEAPCPFVCTAGSCTGICEPKTRSCVANKAQRCDDDGTLIDVALCPFVCSGGVCDGVCQPGTTQCSGNSLQLCDVSGHWFGWVQCAFACAETCVGECVPGERRCEGAAPEWCDDRGEWVLEETCPSGVCNDGICTDLCTPGLRVCGGDPPVELERCGEDGQPLNEGSCPDNCTDGVCTSDCLPGLTRCEGNTTQTCSQGGRWDIGTTCTHGCADGACEDTCLDGDRRCSGTTPQRCGANGDWVSGVPCSQACADGTCVIGECIPQTTRCTGLTPETCSARGEWIAATPCPSTCTQGSCTDPCEAGTTRCEGDVAQACSFGQWQDTEVCSNGCSEGSCAPPCTPGVMQCKDQTPQFCDINRQLEDEAPCPYVCAGGSCIGECLPGAQRCSGKRPQICSLQGEWVSQVCDRCPDFECFKGCSSGECTQCRPGTTRCNGTVIEGCGEDGDWVGLTSCDDTCAEGRCEGTCVEGSRDCNDGTPRICTGGAWDEGEPCGFACSEGECTGECFPGSGLCAGSTPQTCNEAGQWVAGSPCPLGVSVCSDGVCRSPAVSGVVPDRRPAGRRPPNFVELNVGGQAGSCVLSDGGTVWCWGTVQPGLPTVAVQSFRPKPVAEFGNSNLGFAVGGDGVGIGCTISNEHYLWCWGLNDVGQLGDGGRSDGYLPVPVNKIDLYKRTNSVVSGQSHTCAIDADGRVYCWGRFACDGSNDLVPRQVPLEGGATELAAGAGYTCALKGDGTVWCWGDNSFGVLGGGDGLNSTCEDAPVQVVVIDSAPPVYLSGISHLARGSKAQHACAVASNGTFWCWGLDFDGQLGPGGATGFAGVERHAVAVGGFSGKAEQGAVGSNHTCVVAGGTVWCWGDNSFGQLGRPDLEPEQRTPQPVAGLGAAKQVGAGNLFTCALQRDGTVSCWGPSCSGALGNGDLTHCEIISPPIPVVFE